jgi:hypothetical protein
MFTKIIQILACISLMSFAKKKTNNIVFEILSPQLSIQVITLFLQAVTNIKLHTQAYISRTMKNPKNSTDLSFLCVSSRSLLLST